jgi:UDP-N-acetylmuramoyl-L-alanyl-D-glutamate--2,6-diaminopimelate ligase
MRLSELLTSAGMASAGMASAGMTGAGSADPEITSVAYDSRTVGSGTLFCCIPGSTADGHDFADAARRAGAAALVVERELPLDIPQVVTSDARSAMGHLAAAIEGHPCRDLTMVGVTGTNGKTTTTHLIAAILSEAGMPTGVIGTLTGVHTTPESPDLQRRLAEMRAGGDTAVAMEVSSHALALHRVVGCSFAVGVFTNLGRDHLDFHGTVERYFAAKAALFTPELCAVGVVNADDVHGRLLIDAARIPIVGFSAEELTDVVVTASEHSYTWRGQQITVRMGAHFNVMNSLAAATAAAALGLDPAVIAAGLRNARPVPGRFEAVDAGQPFAVVVDYAHTPDGLREVLTTARQVADGARVIVVFGCGGDRDREKRPEMGQVAAGAADVVVVTSDNPRTEDPEEIIASIISGIADDYRDTVVAVEVDRRRAIDTALRAARPGDVVVIAGKGHETSQTIGATVVPFDDRAVARSLLEDLT